MSSLQTLSDLHEFMIVNEEKFCVSYVTIMAIDIVESVLTEDKESHL